MGQMHTEKPNNTSGQLNSPDLRFRNSTTLWGPLQLELINHREGTERGYDAGQTAYREATELWGTPPGFVSAEQLRLCMQAYLDAPRYKPRVCTPKIVEEWQAMFLLGWASQVLAAMHSPIHTTSPTEAQQGERREHTTYRGRK